MANAIERRHDEDDGGDGHGNRERAEARPQRVAAQGRGPLPDCLAYHVVGKTLVSHQTPPIQRPIGSQLMSTRRILTGGILLVLVAGFLYTRRGAGEGTVADVTPVTRTATLRSFVTASGEIVADAVRRHRVGVDGPPGVAVGRKATGQSRTDSRAHRPGPGGQRPMRPPPRCARSKPMRRAPATRSRPARPTSRRPRRARPMPTRS
jgi:hypothetical protein